MEWPYNDAHTQDQWPVDKEGEEVRSLSDTRESLTENKNVPFLQIGNKTVLYERPGFIPSFSIFKSTTHMLVLADHPARVDKEEAKTSSVHPP